MRNLLLSLIILPIIFAGSQSFAKTKKKSGPTPVIFYGLKAIKPFSEGEAKVLSTILLNQFFHYKNYKVLGKTDIEKILTAQQFRQMLACDEPACMTDISSLGSDLIIIGDIGKVENITQVNLQLLSSSKSKVISRASKTVEGDDSLVDAVKELPSELFQASPNKKKVIKKKIIHKKKKTLVDL